MGSTVPIVPLRTRTTHRAEQAPAGVSPAAVRAVLGHLHDLPYLQVHPLARYASPGSGPETAGRALQRCLLEALAALRDPSGRGGRTGDLLALSKSEHYRQLDRGVAAVEFGPTWSPDGALIAFVRAISPSERGLYLMNADGSGQHAVRTGGLVFVPAWQPRGDKLD